MKATLAPILSLVFFGFTLSDATSQTPKFDLPLTKAEKVLPTTTRPVGRSLTVLNQVIKNLDGQQIGYIQKMRVQKANSSKNISPKVLSQSAVSLKSKEVLIDKKVEPIDNGPQALECVSKATVEVMANEITYGGGPHVPTRLDYRIGEAEVQHLFGGNDVTVGAHEDIALAPGEEINLIGKSAYPNFDVTYPIVAYTTPSDHQTNAAILVNGGNYFDLRTNKQIQSAYAGQQSLQSILGNIVNWETGAITLPENQIIILYELGASSGSSPAFDFNDLVVRVTTSCDVGSEITLRDSIGADNSMVNNNRVFAHYQYGGNYTITTAAITAPENLTLSYIRVILGSNSSNPVNFDGYDFDIRVWSSHEAALANPFHGNVADIIMPAPTTGPGLPFAIGRNSLATVPLYELGFDLSSLGITLNAGQSVLMALVPITTQTSMYGITAIIESNETGPSDVLYSGTISGGFRPNADFVYSEHDGRVGVEIRAVRN